MVGLDRITFAPDVIGGKACIRHMRIIVSLTLDPVADGMSADEVIAAYPYIEPDDNNEALHYAAWLSEDSVHPLEFAR